MSRLFEKVLQEREDIQASEKWRKEATSKLGKVEVGDAVYDDDSLTHMFWKRMPSLPKFNIGRDFIFYRHGSRGPDRYFLVKPTGFIIQDGGWSKYYRIGVKGEVVLEGTNPKTVLKKALDTGFIIGNLFKAGGAAMTGTGIEALDSVGDGSMVKFDLEKIKTDLRSVRSSGHGSSTEAREEIVKTLKGEIENPGDLWCDPFEEAAYEVYEETGSPDSAWDAGLNAVKEEIMESFQNYRKSDIKKILDSDEVDDLLIEVCSSYRYEFD